MTVPNGDPIVNNTGTDPNVGGLDTNDELSSKDPKELASMIRDLRKEAADKRVKNRELTSEQEKSLKEFDEWKRSQMTEQEKLKADLDAARAENDKIWADAFCAKYNVPEDKRKFVKGTKEECEEIAQAFATSGKDEEKDGKQTPPANLFPGTRGTAVGSTGKSGTDFDSILRQKLMGS